MLSEQRMLYRILMTACRKWGYAVVESILRHALSDSHKEVAT